MPKFLKPGKIVLILSGRYAGKKAVIMKVFDDGSKDRQFPHALVAGLSRPPLRVTKSMNQKKILTRSKMKAFVKLINLSHLMPTRYTIDVDLKAFDTKMMKPQDRRIVARKAIKARFEERYLEGGKQSAGASWFYTKCKF